MPFIYRIYSIMNLLYLYCYVIYRPLYFYYKNISDKKKLIFLKNYISLNTNVLDIGANIGFYTRFFGKHTKGKVFAFEPDNINFKHLKNNVEKYSNVILNHCAVSNKTGDITIYKSDTFNVDHRTYDTGKKCEKEIIKAIAIDDIIPSNIEINIIKIDIQGYDFFALLGMEKTIKRSSKLLIVGELYPYGLQKSGANWQNYLDTLTNWGFKINFFNHDSIENIKCNENKEHFYTDFYAVKL